MMVNETGSRKRTGIGDGLPLRPRIPLLGGRRGEGEALLYLIEWKRLLENGTG